MMIMNCLLYRIEVQTMVRASDTVFLCKSL